MDQILYIAAAVCFGIEAWRSKSLVALGLFLVAVAWLF